jgi:hypothetical protein
MKKVYFEKGPDRLTMGKEQFERCVPKEVSDEIADALVKKGHFKYFFETADYSKPVEKDYNKPVERKITTRGGK